MVSDRTRDLLFPITILISVAVGAVIGGSFARSGAVDTKAITAASTDSKALIDAVDALRAELTRTREELHSTSTLTVPSQRVDERSPVPDTTSEMRKATAQLIEAADSLRASGQGAREDRAVLVPRPVVDPMVLKTLMAQPEEEIAKSYQMWTYQQVMDRFGPPDEVHPTSNGLCWMYWVHLDASESASSVTFMFTDGHVTDTHH